MVFSYLCLILYLLRFLKYYWAQEKSPFFVAKTVHIFLKYLKKNPASVLIIFISNCLPVCIVGLQNCPSYMLDNYFVVVEEYISEIRKNKQLCEYFQYHGDYQFTCTYIVYVI